MTSLQRFLITVAMFAVAPLDHVAAQTDRQTDAVQFRGGPTHRGVFAGSAGAAYGGLAWRFETHGPVRSSPVVYGELVLVGSADGNLYAIDRRSGHERWHAALDGAVNSAPAAMNGVVFASSMGSVVAAFSARDGRQLWWRKFGDDAPLAWGRESGDLYVSSPTVVAGSVIVGSGDGNVYSLDPATGKTRWQFHTAGRVRSTAAVSGTTVYAASFDGSVYALDLGTGKQRWRFDTEGRQLESGKYGYDRRSIQSSPAVVDGVVYVGSRDGKLYAIDAASGAQRWNYPHDNTSWSIASPAVRDDVVFDASSDALFVHALDRASGKELWRTKTTGAVWSSSAIAGDMLFVGDGAGVIRAIDVRSGAQRWTFQTSGTIHSSPSVADGVVYVGSADGAVYALRTATGPGLQRAVYWDTTLSTRSRFDRRDVRNYLMARGYTLVDSAGLSVWLAARTQDHSPSVVVFALDQAPSDALGASSQPGALRRYLNAGGTAVWIGDPPGIWPTDAKGERSYATLDWNAPAKILDVDHNAAQFDRLGVNVTAAGADRGLRGWWASVWSVAKQPDIVTLGTDEHGLAGAWMKSYGGAPGTGFIYANRVSWSSEALPQLQAVAEMRPIGATDAQAAPAPFDVEKLADGVYAIVRHDPIAFVNNANSLVVVGDSGVLVVDAQFTRMATNQTIGAIRKITTKPVRYVVNTHWHDDHVAGNQVYRDSFPNVRFISQIHTREDLVALGAPNRRGTWDAVTPFTGRFERLLAQGLGGDSTPVVPLERSALQNVIDVGRQYLAERDGFRETLADTTFTTSMTLDLGHKRVDIRWFGEANTRGDAVVFVPASRVVATGDLLVSPVPFAFNAYIAGWIGALDSISARRPAVLLPGHGPVMHDETYLREVRRMLARVRDETRKAVADGLTLADTRKRVTLADERQRISHGDKWLNTIFDSFFLGPAVGRAFEEATASHP